MSKLLTAVAVTAVAAVAAAPASAWTPPTTLSTADEANVLAQSGGSVLTGWLKPVASASKGLGAPQPITSADPFEKVWDYGADDHGGTVVLTVRKHKPVQRIRATLVLGDGTRVKAYTISDNTHSATQPRLAVARDGTAIAAWQWHDQAGWRAQVAIRRPGELRFDKPQTVSPPATSKLRPTINVAAGEGGRAALTWQVQSGTDAALHVLTATDGTFGADQVLPDGGSWSDVALAVSATGAVQVAYLAQPAATTSLRVASGTAGAPLSAPTVLSTGGKGTSSGSQVATAFSADGTATVAWAKPGAKYEDGGTLEVFAAPFAAPQVLAERAESLSLAGGPGHTAALAWATHGAKWSVHAALRADGGAFGADTTLSDPAHHALWPSIALSPTGQATAAWVTNDSGGGSGQPTAATS
ncbi:hypothetical protein OJ997_19585 [Solirubrobacter phytolaccae]|uniref:Uncharacterized protein n=1 Tax=Solirubrobacter phytolaccae TaxID=1404360 RepID=A0A9X3NAT0_9ACTN|nr:hypothetical protein [Solirubrobacter phytolaccae]MDA0182521.1 hypothetical protein [Solirubrobacter phytolaccae]